jgi:hypothetical protein
LFEECYWILLISGVVVASVDPKGSFSEIFLFFGEIKRFFPQENSRSKAF